MTSREKLWPVWAEINLDHVKHNIRETRKILKKDTLICAVIKADAYGHGAVEIGKVLLENGADRFAVATLGEAMELRKAGYTVPILILSYTEEKYGEVMIRNDITQTVYGYKQAQAFSNIAKAMNKNMTIHLKLDTGMSRLGFQPNNHSLDEIKKIFQLPNLIIEGIFTHFATADEGDKTYTYEQFHRFMDFVNLLEKEGYTIPIKHVSNSAAIIDLPEMNLDMVRPGIMLYGLYPSEYVNRERIQLKQVLELKTKVSHIKTLPKGYGVSYGLKYLTGGDEKIITMPVGYADGFTRMLSDKAEVLVKGKRIPVVGRICMNQCMANATGIEDIEVGDEVTLYSSDRDSGLTIDDIAKKLGTINYEIICMLGRQVPRAYLENNNLLQIKDSLLI